MANAQPRRIDQRLSAYWASFKTRGAAKAAAAGLLGVFGWWLLTIVAVHYADQWFGRLAAAVVGFVHFLALQPLGLGLTLVALVFAGVLLWVAWDTRYRPSPQKATQEPPALSSDEKDAIARVRTLWYQEGGRAAATLMLRLLEQAKDQLSARYYATATFGRTGDEFLKVAQELDDALDANRRVPFDRVAEAFNGWFGLYLRSAGLLYDMHQQEDLDLFAPPRLAVFQELRRQHNAFWDKLRFSTFYDGVTGTLRVYANWAAGPLSSRKFLGEQPWDGKQPPPLQA